MAVLGVRTTLPCSSETAWNFEKIFWQSKYLYIWVLGQGDQPDQNFWLIFHITMVKTMPVKWLKHVFLRQLLQMWNRNLFKIHLLINVSLIGRVDYFISKFFKIWFLFLLLSYAQCGRMARWSNMPFFWHIYNKTSILIINKAFWPL